MAIPNEPLTRMEQYLSRTATGGGTIPDEPLTRVEMYLNKIATGSGNTPDEPLTRVEMYLDEIAENGGGGGGETIYESSTGLLYTENFTFNCSGHSIQEMFAFFGNMPQLKELTITGNIKVLNPATNAIASDGVAACWGQAPLLKKLSIVPTSLSNGAAYFAFVHYSFSGTNLTHLTLGSLNGVYFGGNGYFRNDYPVPPGTSKYEIGSLDGMTLSIFTDQFRANGGFQNGALAANTTVIERDYLTGEVLTA